MSSVQFLVLHVYGDYMCLLFSFWYYMSTEMRCVFCSLSGTTCLRSSHVSAAQFLVLHVCRVQMCLLFSFWYYMSTEITSVPYLGALRLLLIPRNTTGIVPTSLKKF